MPLLCIIYTFRKGLIYHLMGQEEAINSHNILRLVMNRLMLHLMEIYYRPRYIINRKTKLRNKKPDII